MLSIRDNVVIIFLIAKFLLYKPVKKMLQNRQKTIEDGYKRAEDAENEAKEHKEAYEKKLEGAKDEANDIISSAVATANARGKEIIDSAKEESQHIVNQARENAELEIKRAEATIKGEIVDVSTAQAPMQTWITKNWGHIAYNHNDGTCDFYMWLLTANEQYTVESNPQYPQFMYYNTEIPMLMPYTCGSGDVTGDGKVTAIDATLVLKAASGMICFPSENLPEADVNCDGVITAVDARIVLRKATEN